MKVCNGRVDMPEGDFHLLHADIFLVHPILYLKYSFSMKCDHDKTLSVVSCSLLEIQSCCCLSIPSAHMPSRTELRMPPLYPSP